VHRLSDGKIRFQAENRGEKRYRVGGTFRYLRHLNFDKISQPFLLPKDLVVLALDTLGVRLRLSGDVRTLASAILIVRESLLIASAVRFGPGLLFRALGSLGTEKETELNQQRCERKVGITKINLAIRE
jgi:hypothetical protein